MKVKNIEFLGENEAVIFCKTANGFEFKIFSHPYKKITSNLFYIFEAKNIIKSNNNEYISSNSNFSATIQGELIKQNLVKVDDVLFELDDNIPNDIKVGDFISFSCDRIDL